MDNTIEAPATPEATLTAKPAPSKWMRVLWTALLFLLVFALVAGIAYWYWDGSTRVPSPGELALTLLALPLVVAVFPCYVLNKHWSKKEAAYQAELAAQKPEAPVLAAPADDVDPLPYLPLVSATVVLKEDLEALVAMAAEAGTAVAMDDTLEDEQGFPIRSGRITDLEVSDEIKQFISDFQDQHPALTLNQTEDFAEVYARKLALLERLLERLQEEGSLEAFVAKHLDKDIREQPLIKTLHWGWLLPSEEAALLPLYSSYTEHWMTDNAGIETPQEGYQHYVVPANTNKPNVANVPMQGLWQMLSDIFVQSKRSWPHMLVLAVDTQVTPQQVDMLADQGMLDKSNRPGVLPSEGAAAVWLGAYQTAPEDTKAYAYQAVQQTCANQAKSKRIDLRPLELCLAELEKRQMLQKKQLALVLADEAAGERHTEEVAQFMTSQLPDLEVLSGRISLRSLVGDVGSSAPLVQWALALQAIEADKQAVLYAHLADAQVRAMTVLRPVEYEEPEAEILEAANDAAPEKAAA